ncbi:MAG TPA: acyl-CoA dehydrogenase family protein [Acidimicrobiales bacterium]|nr:acyl-CoA dehydrogenase family protein [Acidimicrobiales bacterium]
MAGTGRAGPDRQTDGAMFLEETPEQLALRQELRAYYAELLTDEVREGIGDVGEGGELWRQVVRRIGRDGWLGIGWPKEFGGQGRPATDQFIFFDETRRASAPFPFVTVNTVGPTIMRYGNDDQKAFFLPAILAGDVNFAIGYTEPEAGTDLASLRTRAVRDGDEYVVNGAKVFTSGADLADYVWLAVRTDPEAPKHKGISILCVSTGSPGFSWSPIVTVAGASTTATYYADVRVPVERRVGEENEGWRMITTQLNHERVGLAAWSGFASQLFDEVAVWAVATPSPDGGAVVDLPWVQSDLARCRAELDAMYLLNWRMAASLAADTMSPADSSTVKVFGVERSIDIYRRLLGIVGAAAAGYLTPGSPGAVIQGRLERTARHAQINTFGGGVNEIQREIVAMAGLGMTRAAR